MSRYVTWPESSTRFVDVGHHDQNCAALSQWITPGMWDLRGKVQAIPWLERELFSGDGINHLASQAIDELLTLIRQGLRPAFTARSEINEHWLQPFPTDT